MSAPAAGSGPRSFRTFEELEVDRAAREFRKAMYEVARQLPDCEKYGLAGQIRRAAVLLTNNQAEGHGRFHFLDQIRFTRVARGSLQLHESSPSWAAGEVDGAMPWLEELLERHAAFFAGPRH
jgi:hypothetical protein